MRRLVIAGLILAIGTGVFCAFRSGTAQLRGEALAQREAWVAQTQKVAQARLERSVVEVRVRELKNELSRQRQVAMSAPSAAPVPERDWGHLPAALSEKLLAELGFNWNSTGDYLVVSKDSLQGIEVPGMKGMALTDTACQVLAITPEEREAINAMSGRLGADYDAWVKEHVQREAPTGDVVASYTLPADAAFSQSLSNTFTAGVLATLGDERGGLLLQYAYSWMHNLGMSGADATTLTVTRYHSGDEWNMNFNLKQADGNSMTTSVSPQQIFPQAFRSIFPGGWPDLARREGFELPKEFNKQAGQL